MGKINDFFDQFSEEHPLSVFTKILNGSNKDEQASVVRNNYRNETLSLYDISGDEIIELMPNDRVFVNGTDKSKQIYIEAVDAHGNRTVITTCDVADNFNDQRELSHMLDTLAQDIARARRNGAEGITVPVNEYELVAYIRNRPSIEIDLDRLEEAIDQRNRDEIVLDFVNDMHQNKRVDIYTAANNIYNVEATHILKNSFEKFTNIHFYELRESYNHMVYWNDETILNNIKSSPEAVIIGIGLAGEKPMHAISIRNDVNSSVVMKVSFLVGHVMNVREEMLNAQFLKHAVGIEEVARNRNMSEEVKNKVLLELAISEARYRYDDLRINDFLKSVIKVYYTEGKMKLIRVPFNDPNLIMNLIPDAATGLLVEVNDDQIIYYGFDSAAKILIDEFRWIDMGYGRAGHDASRANMRIYEKQASDMTIRTRFITEMNKVLVENVSRSASVSYKYVKEVSEKYNEIGLDADAQIEILPEVPVINDPSYRVSIENIIRETLTKESPFRMFGEIRKGKKPKNRKEERPVQSVEKPVGFE